MTNHISKGGLTMSYSENYEFYRKIGSDLLRPYNPHRKSEPARPQSTIKPAAKPSPIIQPVASPPIVIPERHFELTGETLIHSGRLLHRIRATRNFSDVSKGSLGGWIENEKNIGKDSFAWLDGNSKAFDHAVISDHARMTGNAQLYGYARLSGYAEMGGNSQAYEHAHIYEHAVLRGNAQARGHSQAYGTMVLEGDTLISDNAQAYGGSIARPQALAL